MHVLLRLGISLGLLLTVAWLLDTGDVAARLAHLRAPWVLLALGITAVLGPSRPVLIDGPTLHVWLATSNTSTLLRTLLPSYPPMA